VGKIRAAGFDVVRDEPPGGHALIMLPRLPTDDDYVTISDLYVRPEMTTWSSSEISIAPPPSLAQGPYTPMSPPTTEGVKPAHASGLQVK
jgi:hypothetical protein